MNDRTFDGLVAGFYRAATGEIDWTRALEAVQVAFGARAAVLQTIDLPTGRMLGLHAGGPDLGDALLSYIREFHTIDPRRQHSLAAGPAALGQWIHCHEVFDDGFVASNRFFQHFLAAYDCRYNANMSFAVDASTLTGFVLELPASRGVLTPDEREWARRLGEHMQEAQRAHRRVRALAAQAMAGHGLLRSFPYPMWLIDRERYVHFANDAATRETEAQTRIVQRGSHLLLTRPRADIALTEQLHRMASLPHGASAVIDLRHGSSDAAVWLHLSLLVPEAVFGAFGERPLVLATLFDPQHVSAIDPFALANILKLTPTQAKVAARLAEGMSAEQIAVLHGTAISTVRTHIREVLARLGANRVADVVRMLRQGEALWSKPPAPPGG